MRAVATCACGYKVILRCGCALFMCECGCRCGQKINMLKLQVRVRLNKNGALVGGGTVPISFIFLADAVFQRCEFGL